MKKITVWAAGALVGLLTFVATAGAASASQWFWHESEVPAKLHQK